MKKLITLLLSIVLCLSLCACGDESGSKGEGRLKKGEIAGELDSDTVKVVTDHKTIPDMALFVGRRPSSKEAVEKETKGYQYLELESEEDGTALLEYFALLQKEFGFELSDSYNMDWNEENPFGKELTKGFWSVGFIATQMDAGQELTCFATDTPCDICVYGAEGEVTLVYSSLFNITDTGHRYSGYAGDELCTLFGAHARDAYESDGKRYYNISDETLEVEAGVRTAFEWIDYVGHMGTATIIINDSEKVTTTARIGKPSKVHYYAFDIENIGGVDGQKFYLRLPVEVMEDGAVFCLRDFLSGHQREEEMDCWRLEYTPGYADKEISADYNTSLRGCMEACTIRVLNWEPTGKEDCVVYISMKMLFDGDPLEMECLLAMPVNDETLLKETQEKSAGKQGGAGDGSSGDAWSPNVAEFAKLDCLTCNGTGDCTKCGGDGEVEHYGAGGDDVTSTCSRCHHTGDCQSCGGSGKRD